jgi:outer membrane protein OmpA-like peptidoglycan-associated protein
MRKILALLAGSAVFATSLLAQAQESFPQDFHLRLEPGLTDPFTQPQASLYNIGPQLAVKPELDIKPWLGIGPTAAVTYLPRVNDSNAGILWELGAFVRVKRPHNLVDDGKNEPLMSPWIDGGVYWAHTGEVVNRPAISAAAGLEYGLFNRTLWFGPFVRYDHVFSWKQDSFDTREPNLLTAGLSFDIDFVKPQTKIVTVTNTITQVVPGPTVIKTVPAEKVECPSFAMNAIVQFAYDSAVLDATAQTALDVVVSKLSNLDAVIGAGHVLTVEGHASSEGEAGYNQTLSQNRANAVLNYLVSHGVPANRIVAHAFGASIPAASNTTEEGRSANRRVEFEVNFSSRGSSTP